MRGVPFERYKWMAVSFPGATFDSDQLLWIVLGLLDGKIPTTIVRGTHGPIVVTWQRQANA